MIAFVLSIAMGGAAAFTYHRSSTAEEVPETATVSKGNAPMPTAVRTRPIPPIDADAPQKTETATFAMG
jgi:hypothetical protein